MIDITANKIDTLDSGRKAKVAGVVVGWKEIVTRTGKKMAFFDLDDATATAEVVLFPSLFTKYQKLDIKDGDILICDVRVDKVDPQIKLIPNNIASKKAIFDLPRILNIFFFYGVASIIILCIRENKYA